MLAKIKHFIQLHDLAFWFIAHPAKPQDMSRLSKPPGLFDISGGAHWVNKADVGLIVDRDINANPSTTTVYVRKIRWKDLGMPGSCDFDYDRPTGVYTEHQPNYDLPYTD